MASNVVKGPYPISDFRDGPDVVKVRGGDNVLSNFYVSGGHLVQFQGRSYKSVEHAYQCTKAIFFDRPDVAEHIYNCHSGVEAKSISKCLPKNERWTLGRKDLMRELLLCKSRCVPEFHQALISTGNQIITHPVTDKYWGWTNKDGGLDTFALLLMELRTRLHIDAGNLMVAGEGFCEDDLYGQCPRMRCPRLHIKPHWLYMDSHCHLDHLHHRFGIELARFNYPSQYKGCISNFAFPKLYDMLETLSQHDTVWPTIGLHPKFAYNLDSVKPFLLERAKHQDIVAVGETGLCSAALSNGVELTQQYLAFHFQVELAKDLDKPVVLHCRDFSQECFTVCHDTLPVNHKIHLHCFTGTVSEADVWCNHFPNLKVGVTNMVTFDDSKSNVHLLAKSLDLTRLLIETDAPHFVPRTNKVFLPEVSHPGQALNVAVRISQLKQVSLRKVLASTYDNTKFMYNLP